MKKFRTITTVIAATILAPMMFIGCGTPGGGGGNASSSAQPAPNPAPSLGGENNGDVTSVDERDVAPEGSHIWDETLGAWTDQVVQHEGKGGFEVSPFPEKQTAARRAARRAGKVLSSSDLAAIGQSYQSEAFAWEYLVCYRGDACNQENHLLQKVFFLKGGFEEKRPSFQGLTPGDYLVRGYLRDPNWHADYLGFTTHTVEAGVTDRVAEIPMFMNSETFSKVRLKTNGYGRFSDQAQVPVAFLVNYGAGEFARSTTTGSYNAASDTILANGFFPVSSDDVALEVEDLDGNVFITDAQGFDPHAAILDRMVFELNTQFTPDPVLDGLTDVYNQTCVDCHSDTGMSVLSTFADCSVLSDHLESGKMSVFNFYELERLLGFDCFGGGGGGGSNPPPGNDLPAAVITMSNNGTVGQEVLFDASASSDSDGQVVEWWWKFGDDPNTTYAGELVSHAFSSAGTYSVELTVVDDQGGVGYAQSQIGIVDSQDGPSPWADCVAAWSNNQDITFCDQWADFTSQPCETLSDNLDSCRNGNQRPRAFEDSGPVSIDSCIKLSTNQVELTSCGF